MIGRLLAVLLPLTCAGAAADRKAAPAEGPFVSEAREWIARARGFRQTMKEDMDALGPVMAALEGPDPYPAAPGLRALKERQGALVASFDSGWSRFRTSHYEFVRCWQRLDRIREALMLGGRGAEPLLASMVELERAYIASDAFITRGKAARRLDADRYKAELRRRQARDRRRKGALAAGIVIVLALGGYGWRRRRASQVSLPGYLIERKLGRGDKGVVYEAKDLNLGRRVAVREAVLDEAQSVAALKHPNIVEIYSVLREAGRVYLICESLQGESLAEVLAAKRRLPLKSAQSLVRQVCSALGYAHERGVLHRGLDPASIMVAPSGLVKVMDFGIPRTRTSPYMSPEQHSGSVSKASDLFSLGVCAYEMLTGALPYKGPRLPPEADAFMRRALQAEPGKRFGSAEELSVAFEALPATRGA